jgi:dipeptidyl aminopeptidase/acylaminoacyl peptidase
VGVRERRGERCQGAPLIGPFIQLSKIEALRRPLDAAEPAHSAARVRRPRRVQLTRTKTDRSLPPLHECRSASTILRDRALEVRYGTSPSRLVLLPTGVGTAKTLKGTWQKPVSWASWFADGRRILFVARENNSPQRVRAYIQDTDGGEPHAIGPPDVRRAIVAPDARRRQGVRYA